jgi:hypothetical protein
MIYNWTVTNLFTIDEGTETDYVVTALYNVTGIETVERHRIYRLLI